VSDAPGADSRERVLAAAEECLRRSGIRRTTMTEVARRAGISRAWLYRQFPDKSSLVLAVLMRSDADFWARARDRVSAAGDLADQVAEAVRLSRSQAPAALLLDLGDSDPGAVGALVGDSVGDLLPGLARFWHEHLATAQAEGRVRTDLDVPLAAEWVMRVVMSLVTIPSELVDVDDPGALRAFVEEFLVRGMRQER
jgi:AcrR family transcriptional regulator